MCGQESGKSERIVPLTSFLDYGRAHLARATLEEAGIDCMLGDQNINLIHPLYANIVGGIKLLVRESDLEAAGEVLASVAREHGADSTAVDGGSQADEARDLGAEEPACPQCESNFVQRVGITFWLLLAAMCMLGLPFIFIKPRWRCTACGHQWASR